MHADPSEHVGDERTSILGDEKAGKEASDAGSVAGHQLDKGSRHELQDDASLAATITKTPVKHRKTEKQRAFTSPASPAIRKPDTPVVPAASTDIVAADPPHNEDTIAAVPGDNQATNVVPNDETTAVAVTQPAEKTAETIDNTSYFGAGLALVGRLLHGEGVDAAQSASDASKLPKADEVAATAVTTEVGAECLYRPCLLVVLSCAASS